MTHWINALAVLVMVMSGWRIYNASSIFDFFFPAGFTLGGWLAPAAIQTTGSDLLPAAALWRAGALD